MPLASRVTTAMQVDGEEVDQAFEEEGDQAFTFNLCWKQLIVQYDNEDEKVPFRGTVNYERWEDVQIFQKWTLDGCFETYTARCKKGGLVVKRQCGDPPKAERRQDCLGGIGCVKKKRSYGAGAEIALATGGSTSMNTAIMSGRVHVWAEHPTTAQMMALAHELADPLDAEVADLATWVGEIGGNEEEAAGLTHSLRMLPRFTMDRLRTTARQLLYTRNRDHRTLGALLAMSVEQQPWYSTYKDGVAALAAEANRYKVLSEMDPSSFDTLVDYMVDPAGMPDQMMYYMHGQKRHPDETSVKPRALIFSCSYGSGHNSAAQALTGYLKRGGFEVEVADTTKDRMFRSHREVIGDYLFNEVVLKGQWYRTNNVVDTVKWTFKKMLVRRCPAPWCNHQRKAVIRSAILKARPDIIITVYHMDLLPILELAAELGGIPLMHLATDMDTKMREVFSKKGPVPIYPRFEMGLPFGTDSAWATVKPLHRSQTFRSGYPVRPEFLEPQPNAHARSLERAKHAPPDTYLILIMTGGSGQDVPWPELFANGKVNLGTNVHIMICAGGHTEMATRLQVALPGRTRIVPDGREVWQGKSSSVTVEVLRDPTLAKPKKPYFLGARFLKTMMDVSDALITKPGGGSTAEAAYRGIPAAFDATAGLLHWEEFTVKEFEAEKRGLRIEHEADLQKVMKQVLSYGRSTKLAQDPLAPGPVINTGNVVRAAARRLMSKGCPPPCFAFADDVAY